MNPYKKRRIIEHVLGQGLLPKDEWGKTLPPEDLLVWFGLSRMLDRSEQDEIKREFVAIAEAEEVSVALRADADPLS